MNTKRRDESDSEEEIPRKSLKRKEKRRKNRKNVKLEEYQISHYEKMKAILDDKIPRKTKGKKYQYIFIDRSATGRGKTEIEIAYSEEHDLPIVAFVPKKIHKTNWERRLKRYKCHNKGVYTYRELAGSSAHQPSSPFLTRNHNLKPKLVRTKVEKDLEEEGAFEVTDELLQLIEEGCLFVFDEGHKLKSSKASQTIAVARIVRAIKESKSQKSKACILSATLFDKKVFSLTILKMLGIVTHIMTKINIRTEGREELTGAQEVFDFASEYQPELVELIREKYEVEDGKLKYDSTKLKDALYEVFSTVILDALSSAMPDPEVVKGTNLFVDCPIKSVMLINKGILNLKKAVNYDEITGTTHTKKVYGVGPSQILIEEGLVDPMAQITKELLKIPKRKVCLFVGHRATFTLLEESLRNYEPKIINGDTSDADRQNYIDLFQQPNCQCRLLITSILITSECLDLDDKDGGYVRSVLAMPTWDITALIQASGRFKRGKFTKSEPEFSVLYPVNTDALMPIYKAMVAKSSILKDMGKTNTGKTPTLLSDFQNRIYPRFDDGREYPERNQKIIKEIERMELIRKAED